MPSPVRRREIRRKGLPMKCCVPCYDVTAIAIDTTTGIATLTVGASSISAGRFDLRFRLCCQSVSPCWTETINLAVGTATVTNVLGRDGNAVKLGQLAKQISCRHVLHCNYTSSPSGNVVVLDKVPACTFSGTVSVAPTVITVDA